MIKQTITLLFLSLLPTLMAQQLLELKPVEVEELFIKQNLELVAQKINVSIADAAIVQAKLWDNPSIALSGVNLWSGKNQREEESIPPLWGSFARNTQFSVELSQMVSLSGRRAKLVGMEKLSREMAVAQFELILLGLKCELRKWVTEMLYWQNYSSLLALQRSILHDLLESQTKQLAQGNLSTNEIVRLQSALLETDGEANAAHQELNAVQRQLKNLLSSPNDISIRITPMDANFPDPSTLNFSDMTDQAKAFRADVNLQKLQTDYCEKSIGYEKSLRRPDLGLSIGYDRRGGVWRDFIGFGIGMDLPVFNRNQGAIKTAQLLHEQSTYRQQQQQRLVFNEVAEAFSNYMQVHAFYVASVQNPILSQLDRLLEAHTKNLLQRNISMLEYMDFMTTYRSAKQTMLAAKRDVQLRLEELKYATGTEELDK